MALSNIFREPRREITEQLIGLLVTLPVGLWLWHFTRIIHANLFPTNQGGSWIVAGMISAFSTFFGVGILFLVSSFIHTAGEKACNWLATRGLELRPKERYR